MADDPIVVIGSGVAGMSATRRLMLAGHPVVMVAPDKPVPSRGETLSPRALPVLRQLQWDTLLNAPVAIPAEGRFSVWGSPKLRQADGSEQAGWHVDRALMEMVLLKTIDAAGVHRMRQTVAQIRHGEHGLELLLADGQRLRSAAVVDCSGRAALSSGPAASRKRVDKLVALWAILDFDEDAEALAATLVETTELGWWYTSIMPGRRLMIGLFTDSDLLPSGAHRGGAAMSALMTSAQNTQARITSLGLGEALGNCNPQVAPAATAVGSSVVEGRLIRSGDAAAAMDPLGANGLAMALWSGARAAEAALALLESDRAPAERYEQSFLEGIARQLTTQADLYTSEPRFRAAPFWARRNSASPRL